MSFDPTLLNLAGMAQNIVNLEFHFFEKDKDLFFVSAKIEFDWMENGCIIEINDLGRFFFTVWTIMG